MGDTVLEYKLTYFDTQGLAEPMRYLFAIAGVKYEDIRLPKDEHWPYLVPEVKARFPWGTVPVLDYKGFVIGQSTAATRFLAKKFNLVGENELEEARCDEIVDSIIDFRNEYLKMFYESDEGRKDEIRAKLVAEVNPNYYKIYENILTKNKAEGRGNWIVGKSITWADVLLAHSLIKFGSPVFGTTVSTDHLKDYPHLKQLVEAFHDLPAIKKWMSERPTTI